ncbi:MAG: O-antigen ligase family protein [Candidatus Riflebacteria bacterium]|nr:O-antigen ligase family protein [Candidatus Riflebacteria bacterium]
MTALQPADTLRNRWELAHYWGMLGYAIASGFSITLSQTALVVSLIGLIGMRGHENADKVKAPFLPAYYAFTLAGILSLFNAVDLGRGIIEMKKFLMILVMLIPLWSPLSIIKKRNVLGTCVVIGALSGLSAILSTIYFMLIKKGDFRGEGFFSLPLTMGETQLLFLILSLAWLEAEESNPRIRWGVFFAGILQFFGMVFAYTRGAFIGFLAGVIILFRQNIIKILGILGISLLIIAASGDYFRPGQQTLVFSESVAEGSFKGNLRWGIWKNGIELLTKCPIFGVGMNNIKPLYKKLLEEKPEYPDREIYGHLHNNYLQYLVMTGIVGFFTFCWFLWEVLRFGISIERSATPGSWEQKMARAIPALWIAFLGTGLTEYSYGDEEVAMLAFFLVGLIASIVLQKKPAVDLPIPEIVK